MKETAHEGQERMVELVLNRHLRQCSFLVERCESGCLTPEQRAAIRNRIDDLNEQNRILRWLLGTRQSAPAACQSH